MKGNITIILILIYLYLSAGAKQLNLQTALDLKLVKALVKSTGGYQGFCIQMELKNMANDSLIILLEAGRRLNSMDDRQQDILVTQEQFISLKKLETKSFPVKGYCCQASMSVPQTGALYSANKMGDENLIKLAKYINAFKSESSVEQHAVWALSDNRPISMIASAKDSTLSGLQLLVGQLKGEKIPWYSLISATHVFPSGNMQTKVLWLRGQLEYNNDKTRYTTLHVLNNKGEEVCRIVQQWSHPGLGQKYYLNLPVKDLIKGRYTVELKSDSTLLAIKEFDM